MNLVGESAIDLLFSFPAVSFTVKCEFELQRLTRLLNYRFKLNLACSRMSGIVKSFHKWSCFPWRSIVWLLLRLAHVFTGWPKLEARLCCR